VVQGQGVAYRTPFPVGRDNRDRPKFAQFFGKNGDAPGVNSIIVGHEDFHIDSLKNGLQQNYRTRRYFSTVTASSRIWEHLCCHLSGECRRQASLSISSEAQGVW
jgi:hypothetical protein